MKIKKVLKKMLYSILGVLALLTLTIVVLVNFLPSFGAKPSGERLEKIKNSEQYKVDKFSNSGNVKEDFTFEEYRKIFAKMFKGNPKSAPEHALPFQKWTKDEVDNLQDSTATAVWYGHSSFYLKMNGKNILIDPMFGDYPAPLPYLTKKRYNDTLPIAIADLPQIDVIILSHDHYDHLDYNSILELKDKTKRFLVPLGVGSHLESWGVDKNKIIELDWWENQTIDDITFRCTPSQHFSGRGLTDKQSTLWSSWVIEGKQKIYFSGDSGYFDGFKEIGAKYGPFDVCLMECGQYDELWPDIHMFPEQTGQAHLDLKGKTLIPIHWGGFTLANHNWDDSIKRLVAFSEENNIDLATPQIGEPILIGKQQAFSKWWLK